MSHQSIGNNLVYQRKLKGFTQAQLAELSSITIRTIQRIERNEVSPQLHTVQALADALEIPLSELQIVTPPKDESHVKLWLFSIHVAAIIGFIFPFSVLFPFVLWMYKKDDHALFNEHGIKAVNFQLTMTIFYVLAFVSLITVKGFGFIFFMTVFPFNLIVIMYNIFKSTTAHSCYYPLTYPFIKDKINGPLRNLTVVTMTFILLNSCGVLQEKDDYQRLEEFQGKYEYLAGTTLNIHASALDTVLYAVIDKAKYPLRHIEQDSFLDAQNSPVVFLRNEDQQVTGYRTSGQIFKLINKELGDLEMLPRKSLFKNPQGYQYKKPEFFDDGLTTGTLNDAFSRPELVLDMVKETIAGSYPDVHSILIYKGGKLVLEEYFYGYDKDTPHQLRSATKPFIGALVGIAIDRGFIESDAKSVLPFFQTIYDDIDHPHPLKDEMRIRDLLMYRHGLDCENSNPESKGNELLMMQSEDWVKHTLDLPVVQKPGTSSSYCTGCAHVLGSLVEITTEVKIEDFAAKYLFQPMAISNYTWTFDSTPASSQTFSTMSLTPRDLIKLAVMYQQFGKWKGEQILSQEWVEKTFDMDSNDYGYLWRHKVFKIDHKEYHSYMASGNGGQKINIWPELDMITVFTGGNYNSYALYGKSTPPNEMIPNYILRAL